MQRARLELCTCVAGDARQNLKYNGITQTVAMLYFRTYDAPCFLHPPSHRIIGGNSLQAFQTSTEACQPCAGPWLR